MASVCCRAVTTRDEIRSFILEQIKPGTELGELTDDYPLIDRGVIDSIGIFQLVSFVEGEFGIEIDDAELVEEHFGTIAGLARLIESKQPSSG